MGFKMKTKLSDKADKLIEKLVDEIIALSPRGSLTSEQKLMILRKVQKAQEIGYDEAFQFYISDVEDGGEEEPFDEEYEDDDDEITWGYGSAD